MSRTWHRKRDEERRGSKRFDKTCRNHGGCPWCENGRKHKHDRRAPAKCEHEVKE